MGRPCRWWWMRMSRSPTLSRSKAAITSPVADSNDCRASGKSKSSSGMTGDRRRNLRTSRHRFRRTWFSHGSKRDRSRRRGRFFHADMQASWVASRASASSPRMARACRRSRSNRGSMRSAKAPVSPSAARATRASSPVDTRPAAIGCSTPYRRPSHGPGSVVLSAHAGKRLSRCAYLRRGSRSVASSRSRSSGSRLATSAAVSRPERLIAVRN